MKKSSFARAAEAALIALALCVMAVLVFSVQRISEESNLAALSAVGGWYRVENGERVSVALRRRRARRPLHRRTDGGGRGARVLRAGRAIRA